MYKLTAINEFKSTVELIDCLEGIKLFEKTLIEMGFDVTIEKMEGQEDEISRIH
jgi:hypothetical protein